MTEVETKCCGNTDKREMNWTKLEDLGGGTFQKEDVVHSVSEREQTGLSFLRTRSVLLISLLLKPNVH